MRLFFIYVFIYQINIVLNFFVQTLQALQTPLKRHKRHAFMLCCYANGTNDINQRLAIATGAISAKCALLS